MKFLPIMSLSFALLCCVPAQAGVVSFEQAVKTALAESGKKQGDARLYQDVLFELIRSRDNVVVKFYATWCGPCKKMKQEIAQVMNSLEQSVLVIDIDIDKYSIPGFSIQTIPHLIYYKKGNKVDEHKFLDAAKMLARMKRVFGIN